MKESFFDEKQTHQKSNTQLPQLLSGLMSNEMLLPLLLFFLLNKQGQEKVNTEDLYRTTEILKAAQPYFKDKPKEMLSKTENMVDILYAMNRFANGEYKRDDHYARGQHDVPDKHIKIMQAVRPYVKGKGRENIDKVLTVHDRVNRLKSNKGQKRVLEDFEHMTDILEILQQDKGYEVRQMLEKVKGMMHILRK